MSDARPWHAETVAVTAGRSSSPGSPLNVPPTFASTYRDGGPVAYGRWANPTWSAFEEALGELEGGHCVAFASGQAAMAALLRPLARGTRVGYTADAYTGNRALVERLQMSEQLIGVALEVTDTALVLDALSRIDVLWLESPTNPLLGVADLPRILEEARARGVVAIVDNTFATPLVQQPLAWGATAVVHSATKYLAGHSDALLGAVVVDDAARRDRLIEHRTLEGAVPGVMESYLALRGLRTLPVRFARQQASAAVLAERLAAHPAVTLVRYPGLADDPSHERAVKHMEGFGAVVSFEVHDAATADRLVGDLELIVPATSLGGVESTIERRQRWTGDGHVPPGLLRLSVGLEHVEDLWVDLRGALDGAVTIA